MSEPPAITAGTILRLQPGEWRNDPQAPNRVPSDDLTIVVAHVYTAVMGGMVWLKGHLDRCGVDCPRPCVEGQVAVTALRRHAGG